MPKPLPTTLTEAFNRADQEEEQEIATWPEWMKPGHMLSPEELMISHVTSFLYDFEKDVLPTTPIRKTLAWTPATRKAKRVIARVIKDLKAAHINNIRKKFGNATARRAARNMDKV